MPGCGKSNSIGIPGETITWTTTYKGVDYDQLLTLPSSYTGETPVPLQIHHHGWGSSSSECGSACAVKAPEHGFAAISVQGDLAKISCIAFYSERVTCLCHYYRYWKAWMGFLEWQWLCGFSRIQRGNMSNQCERLLQRLPRMWIMC